ncbi:MAG: phage tail tape measure protein, partial [Bacteroidetes bacterium HGW-Bacteroidetes-22]
MAGGATRRVSIYINEKEIEASIKDVRKEYAKLNAQQDKLIMGSEEYNLKAKKIRELKKIINDHNQNVGKIATTWESVTDKMMKFGAGMGGFTMLFQTVDAGIGKLKNLATEVAEIDDVYSDVQKTTQMTRDQVLDLNESFKKMDTRTAREELNKYAYIAGKLGIEQKDLVLEFVEGSNIISVALSDALGEDSIELIGKIVNVYTKSTEILKGKSLKEQMLSIGSGLNVIGQTSTANEQYVVSFMGRLGGLSVQAKLAANDIMGFASALDQDMQAVELSATAFQKLIKNIMTEPGKFAKIAGVEVKAFTKMIETDMNQAILKVLRGFAGTGGMTKLLPIFKDLGLDAERATQAIASMANSVDKIEVAQKQANQAMTEGTSVINEYNIKNNNMQAELEKSRKAFQDKRMELGEKLYPVLIKVTKSSTALIKGIGGLFKVMENNKELIIALSVLYGAYLLRLLQVSLAKKGLTTHTLLLSKVQAIQTAI